MLVQVCIRGSAVYGADDDDGEGGVGYDGTWQSVQTSLCDARSPPVCADCSLYTHLS